MMFHDDDFLDKYGQPINPWMNHDRVKKRTTDELIGICKGILADTQVVLAEAEFLLDWLHKNHVICHQYPARNILERLTMFLKDGKLDDAEAKKLKKLLLAVTGLPQNDEKMLCGHRNPSTRLPLDNPMPMVELAGKTFCFTGAMKHYTRDSARQMVLANGGKTATSISRKVDYLVVGSMGSRDWLHSSHGTKIREAIKLRDEGVPIKIISEEHWCSYLRL